MNIYKFMIRDEYRRFPEPNPHNLEAKNCLLLVLAESEEQARELANETLGGQRWLEVADVIVFSLATPKILGYSI